MKKILLALISLLLVFNLAACEKVAEPKVTQGEFPFELVYEINGEAVTVTDVYVCEYEGIGSNENIGKHREWGGHVKSTGEVAAVLLEEGNVKVLCRVGYPEYYMSEPTWDNGGKDFVPSVYYTTTFESGGVASGELSEDALLEKYNIKLVSWSFSEPIENSFE